MSNNVWVTWKGAAGEDPLVDKVIGLDDEADVSDLRRKFVEQHEPDVKRATVSVLKQEGGEKLKVGEPLKDYFALTPGSAGLAGPGKSEDTALFVTFPNETAQISAFKPVDGKEASIWDHLNTPLPHLDDEGHEVDTQKNSTTEYAAYSTTPTALGFWTNFDNLVQAEGRKAENHQVVQHNIQESFCRYTSKVDGTGIVLIAQEEDVTQNTVRVLDAAASLLGARCIAGNKYVKANTDVTIVRHTGDELAPTSRAAHMKTRRLKVLLPLETKPKWNYEFLQTAGDNYFVNTFEVQQEPASTLDKLPASWSSDKKKVYHLVRQVCGQMKQDKLRFGCFHIYTSWWFCELTGDGLLKMSRRYDWYATNPSVLQGLKTLVAMDFHRFPGKIADHNQSPKKKRKTVASINNRKDGGGDNSNKPNKPEEQDDKPKSGGSGKTSHQKRTNSTNRGRQRGSHSVTGVDGNKTGTNSPPPTEYSNILAQGTPPRARDLQLQDCTLLDSLSSVKILSTGCGSGFVKMVRDPRMKHAVAEMKEEAAIYNILQERDPTCEAFPSFYGISDDYGVPLIVLGMEGPSFEEIGVENLPKQLKAAAVESLESLTAMGILHGDIALRNVVQSKSNKQKAKIVDFGRSSMCSDESLLRAQVQTLKRLLAQT